MKFGFNIYPEIVAFVMTTLSLFVLEDVFPDGKVFLDKDMVIATDDIGKAYRYFFEKCGYWSLWDLDEERNHDEPVEHSIYSTLTDDQKNEASRSWFNDERNKVKVHCVPIKDIEGMSKLYTSE